MKCEICGTEYKDTDRFCGICGTPNPLFEIKPAPEEYRPEPSDTGSASEALSVSEAPGGYSTADPPKASEAGETCNFPDPAQPSVMNEAFGSVSETLEPVSKSASETISEPVKITDTAEASENTEIAGASEPFAAEKTDEPDNNPETAQSTEATEPTEKAEAAEPPINRPFTAPGTIPVNQPNQAAKTKQKPPKDKKEKRVCSLSAVIICIVIILILSIVCGALGGLYLGEKAKVRNMRHGSITAPFSYSEFYNKNNLTEK